MSKHCACWAVVTVCWFTVGQIKAGPIEWSTTDGGNGHYYDLVLPVDASGSYTWTAAKNAAAATVFEGSHGHLATVTSQAENDFLYNTFGSQIRPDYALQGGAKGDQVWIGLTDYGNFPDWQWITGEPFSYSNWAPTEPNYPWLEFDGLYWRRDFGNGPLFSWNNAADDPYDLNLTRYGYFVEFDGPFTPTPEPASLLLFGIGGIGVLAYRRNRRQTARF